MKYWIIDANVILLAGTHISKITYDQVDCWKACIDFIHEMVCPENMFVVDDRWRILKEYIDNSKSINGYPNNSSNFVQYILTNQGKCLEEFPLNEVAPKVFEPYPKEEALVCFDPSDRKYIALAYAHSEHPPIVEAADSKWWGIQEALRSNGMDVMFVDKEYIRKKYEEKMGKEEHIKS